MSWFRMVKPGSKSDGSDAIVSQTHAPQAASASAAIMFSSSTSQAMKAICENPQSKAVQEKYLKAAVARIQAAAINNADKVRF